MTTSKKLTPERIAEIKAFPITYDKDCPKLTDEQLSNMRPAYPEYFKVVAVKKAISIKIDVDVLEFFKSTGKGYQSRINAILRQSMRYPDLVEKVL